MKLGNDGEFTEDIRTPKRKHGQMQNRKLEFVQAGKHIAKIGIIAILILVILAVMFVVYMRITLPTRTAYKFADSINKVSFFPLGGSGSPMQVDIPDGALPVGGNSEHHASLLGGNYDLETLGDVPTLYPVKECSIFGLPDTAQGVYAITKFTDNSLIAIDMPMYVSGAVNVCTTAGHIVDVALWVKVK